MPYLDILALVTSDQQEPIFLASQMMAEKGGHLAFVHLTEIPAPFVDPLTPTATAWNALVVSARASGAAVKQKIESRLTRLEPGAELRSVESIAAFADAAIGAQSMHADVTVMEAADSALGRAAFEGALFKSGRPVLLIPPGWTGQSLGSNVVIAWKPTREAARAVADALPFLREAKRVTLLRVDTRADDQDEAPNIASHLERHGVHIEVRNTDPKGRRAEEAILSEARILGADLIVMGGYGHARLTEFVFGGVTRSLSREPPIPVLMSH